MVEPSVALSLHCLPRSVISTLSLPHSLTSSKLEKLKWRPCRGRQSGHRFSDSSRLFIDSPRSNFQARAAEQCEWSNNAAESPLSTETEKRMEFRQADMGRYGLVSATAAVLVQCAYGGDLAIAATYSPSVVDTHSSSLSVGKFDHCNTVEAPNITFTKKSRTGSHGKASSLLDGLSKQSTVSVGTRKPALLVKRAGGYLPRLKDTILARQVACSSVGGLPLASISVATFTNSFTAISRLGLALDFSVLRSSFGTSFNLLSLCSLVVWMQRSGQLPADTPVILSQVAFKLFIPCFLVSKVATTLTASSASNLVALPLLAVAQVIVGAVLGRLACRIFFRVPSLQTAVEWSGSEAGDSSSLSLAFTEHQQKLSRAAIKKQALITAACAFGNSLTLPLVFLSGVLASSEDTNRAAGYLALYMVGWSPAMWSVGYKILTAGDEENKLESSGEKNIILAVTKWIGSVMNPPLYGVLVGLLIGGTPLSHLFLGSQAGTTISTASTMTLDAMGIFAKLRCATEGILSPVFEAASLLGTATLAVQTVVLATSLGATLPKPGESSRSATSSLEAGSESLGELETRLSKTEGVLDSKAFWVISLVRLILLPFTGILFSVVLQYCNMLPRDPIYRLVILAESSMPTAQNLVLLAQLNAGTRPLAGMLAELLLRQYALSVIPITMWMAIFLTFTPVT